MYDTGHLAVCVLTLFVFVVVKSLPRNCTSISPCQQDATLIRDAEIAANIVNECGRTELQGNIDIGENTENALAAQQVTQVQSSGTVTITMHQVNADGAGPFNVSERTEEEHFMSEVFTEC